MEKYINEFGKECYRGVTEETDFSKLEFHEVDWGDHFEQLQWALHTNIGSLTVVERMTGFGWRDTETGFCSPDGKFWLASGMIDVRRSDSKTMGEAIAFVKLYANTCIPESDNP